MPANIGTSPPGLDLGRLRERLAAHGLAAGTLTAEVIHGGKSNLTYLVRDGDRGYVVRRPPLGHVLATAHDMGREFRVMTALRDTGVPVPRTYHLCEDPDVIGAPFYVMEYVEGDRPPATPALDAELVAVLARLHEVDPAAVGLDGFGRPEGFLERQVRRWKRQLDASRGRDLPGMDALHDRLAGTVPVTQRHAIVHGDFKLGNTIIAAGRVRAVLDWEMSTLGDPLTDLALFLLYAEFEALDMGEGARAGEHMPGAELARRYARGTGLDLSRLGWYVALACFKLAVIAEGIHVRHARGLTVGDGFDDIGGHVAPLVSHGLRALESQEG
ncbi:acyl-CoA dehydrogenase [Sphaerisporangium krabiense]|uniref:Aminoglycoside phosphotransferase (APT) family kinase protein n=1 Tax=Sphaerisporangium krabiense TaxID=763782 RepID=A0A7W8Z6B1_9ACTN|nr:phosphotransferase family protein [Sphaerisporangium krabiense]MBB5628129.1 aminoglycoside phosphotransferase (APT) family kinase protein [Sphaerisporangium krabiense]GII62296.1 acyl-CoA dehydrogenase [Sphaerisporangium krabiense]